MGVAGSPGTTLHDEVFLGGSVVPLFSHRGVSLCNGIASGMAVLDYPVIGVAEFTRLNKALAAINEGSLVMRTQFLCVLRIHPVAVDTHVLRISHCDGIVMWLLVKESGFELLLQYSWKYVSVAFQVWQCKTHNCFTG